MMKMVREDKHSGKGRIKSKEQPENRTASSPFEKLLMRVTKKKVHSSETVCVMQQKRAVKLN